MIVRVVGFATANEHERMSAHHRSGKEIKNQAALHIELYIEMWSAA